MRLYSITNMYLSSIQQGIQTQHSTVELFIKYRIPAGTTGIVNGATKPLAKIETWADLHKTTIVLNGGMHHNLVELLELMEGMVKEKGWDHIPFAPFYEPGLNNALTSISIIMNEQCIEFMSQIRDTDAQSIERENIGYSVISAYGYKAFEVLQKMAFMGLAK